MKEIQLSDELKRQINWRSEESFPFARGVTFPYGFVDQVLRWCKSECQGDWRWQLIESSSDVRPGRYVFYFDREQDCCAFTLKWQVDQ